MPDVIVAVAPEVPPVTVSFDWKVPDLDTDEEFKAFLAEEAEYLEEEEDDEDW